MNNSKLSTLRLAPVLTALLAGSAFFLVSERDARAVGQATGRVTGTIIEEQTQAPVPGANIQLTGGSGVNQKGQSSEDGTFELLNIPPGTYDLLITYEGLKPVRRKVVVNPDAATPVNIVWKAEQAAEETTVVEEERHLTNPDSPQTGTIYTTQRQNQLPMARQYQSVATQVPGVTVGGGNPNVKGGTTANNRYLVNGLDLTDPVTNTFSANFQQDSLDSIEVTTGGFEAKYNALGSIVAVNTKRGTNEFHGSASAYWAPTFLVDYRTFGGQLYDGSKTWDYSKQRPNQASYELNANAQGPIVKDHIFFNAGIQFLQSNQVQPPGPPRFAQAPTRVFEAFYLTGGVTFVPVDAHRIHVEVFGDPTTIDYENNSTGTGFNSPNASHPYSQAGRFQGGYRATVEWSWQANKHVSTKVLAGFNQNALDVGPQGLRKIDSADLEGGVPYSFQRPQHLNFDDSTSWWNTNARTQTTRRRYQLDASVTATGEAAGRHEAEFGVQTSFIEQNEIGDFTGGTSTKDGNGTGYGVAYTDRGGGPLQTGLCDLDPYVNPGAPTGNYTGNGCFQRQFNRSYAAHDSGNQFAVYLQDRYKPTKWLTILPGIRWDAGTVRATNSTVAETAYGFGPRLSALADVTNDQKTILQASYGRMTEMPVLGGVVSYDEARRNLQTVEQYDATSRRFVFQQTTGGSGGTRLDFGHTPASADEFLVSGRREVTKGVLARLDYTYRVLRREFEATEINAIYDPTGTRTIGFVNGQPTQIFSYGFQPRSVTKYSGLDLILETKFKDFELQGGYTLSQTWGTSGNAVGGGNISGSGVGGAFDNPRFAQFYDSYVTGVDTRHEIKSSSTYQVFPGFTVGLILNWRSGVALTKTYPTNEGTSVQRRAPTGYDPGSYYNTGTSNPYQLGTFSDVRSWSEFRSPDLLTTNLMLTYDFFPLIKQHVQLNAAITNVLALVDPTSVLSTEGSPNSSTYGLANGHQAFRSVQLGLRYEF